MQKLRKYLIETKGLLPLFDKDLQTWLINISRYIAVYYQCLNKFSQKI